MTACWAGPFGAVRDEDLPSWLTAVPWTIREYWDTSSSDVSSIIPQESALTYPSAEADKVLHRPSAASIPAFWNMAVVLGIKSILTPPLNAFSHCPSFMLFTAVCNATREDEHAVSTGTAGPWNPKVYETRPAATLMDSVPVADKGE